MIYIIAKNKYQALHWAMSHGLYESDFQVVSNKRKLYKAEKGSFYVKTGDWTKRSDIGGIEKIIEERGMVEFPNNVR